MKNDQTARAAAKKDRGDAEKKTPGNTPLRRKEDVQQSNDERIDQDFPGYPHPPSKEADKHNGSANAFERTENPADEED